MSEFAQFSDGINAFARQNTPGDIHFTREQINGVVKQIDGTFLHAGDPLPIELTLAIGRDQNFKESLPQDGESLILMRDEPLVNEPGVIHTVERLEQQAGHVVTLLFGMICQSLQTAGVDPKIIPNWTRWGAETFSTSLLKAQYYTREITPQGVQYRANVHSDHLMDNKGPGSCSSDRIPSHAIEHALLEDTGIRNVFIPFPEPTEQLPVNPWAITETGEKYDYVATPTAFLSEFPGLVGGFVDSLNAWLNNPPTENEVQLPLAPWQTAVSVNYDGMVCNVGLLAKPMDRQDAINTATNHRDALNALIERANATK